MIKPLALPYKETVIEKVYFSIGEVAAMFKVNPSLLRFWEKEFDTLAPRKNRKGTRQYSRRDIEQIRIIFHLVKEKGMTLDGARKKIRENRDEIDHSQDVIRRLQDIRNLLKEMHDQL